MNLLLLHGFLGTPSTWDRVVPGTGAPLLPGHGPDPDMSPASFEAAVDAIAASLLPGPVIVAGYSMGARLALGLAVRHPGLVRAAVLASVNPGLGGDERAARIAWDDAQAATLIEHGLPAFVDGWERLPLFATQRRLSEDRRDADCSR